MGMSSSQARLLTLTGRMHDIEYKAARLEAQKLQMANESRRVYNDYLNALEVNKYVAKTMASDGSLSDIPFTANTIYSYGQFNEQYILSAPQGQALIPSAIHTTYQSTNNLEEFLSANSVSSNIVQREVHTPYDNPAYTTALNNFNNDTAEAIRVYNEVTIPNWEAENAAITAQEQADYDADMANYNTDLAAYNARLTAWDAYDGTGTLPSVLTSAQKTILQDWADSFPSVSDAETDLKNEIASGPQTEEAINAKVDTLNASGKYKGAIINETDKITQEKFMNSAKGCYNTAVAVDSHQTSCFLHVLSYIIDYDITYDAAADESITQKAKDLGFVNEAGELDFTSVFGSQTAKAVAYATDDSVNDNNKYDIGETITGFDLNKNGILEDDEKTANNENLAKYAEYLEFAHSVHYGTSSYVNMKKDVFDAQNDISNPDNNPKTTTTGEKLIVKYNPYDGGFGYYGGFMTSSSTITPIAEFGTLSNGNVAISNGNRQDLLQASRQNFAEVATSVRIKKALASTAGLTAADYNSMSLFEKLSGAYCLDDDGNITTKNLRQWAIDLYYVYNQWASLVPTAAQNTHDGQNTNVQIAGDTQSFTFVDVQNSIKEFYAAMGKIDVRLDETKYLQNKANAKPSFPETAPNMPQRTDYDYSGLKTEKPELVLPQESDYGLDTIPKTLISITTENFSTFSEPDKARYYINLWGAMDGREELPVLEFEIVHDDAENRDIPIYSVQSYAKTVSTYSTNPQTNTTQNENYIVIPNDMLNNEAWIYNVVNSGFALMQRYDAKQNKFVDTAPAVITDISEVVDETKLRKVEAKYEADMKRIDLKDRKYDTDLAALETERNAIKQEIETLKTVIKDNTDRTFKLFS